MVGSGRKTIGEIKAAKLPRRFGNYLLVQSLARGGMGEVFLSKYQFNEEEGMCVVKTLLGDLTRDREYVTRFVDEARVVVTLEHPNIAEVFDVGRCGKEYYLAMEYVSGTDVKSIQDACIERAKPLALAASLKIVIDVLGACDYAHHRRHPLTNEKLELVHRDISPHNIVVDYNGRVKLIDFGLASSRLKIEKTEPNVVMGKMAYMGPEQARGDIVDGRADLFAVAVILYELLTGERYYSGLTPNDIWNTVGKGGFIPRRFSSLDAPLQKILKKGLQSKPRRRPRNCKAFQQMLINYLASKTEEDPNEVLHAEITSLFADKIDAEQVKLDEVNGTRFAQFGPAVAPEIGRDQSTPRLDFSEHSILTTREKQLVLEATEIVARRAPRFHDGFLEPANTDEMTYIPRTHPAKKPKAIAAGVLLAVGLGVGGAYAFLGDSTGDETSRDKTELTDGKPTTATNPLPGAKDDKKPVRKAAKKTNSKKSSKKKPSKKSTKKRSSIKSTASIKRRVAKLKRCKSKCATSLRKRVSGYSRTTSTRKKRFALDVSKCERTCRRR